MGGRTGHRTRPPAGRPVVTTGRRASFPEVIARVGEVLYQPYSIQEFEEEVYCKVSRIFDELEIRITPVRPKDQLRFEEMRQGLDRVRGHVARMTSSPRPEKLTGLHPLVSSLVHHNLLHAAERGDLEATLDELREVVAFWEPPKRRRGRPPTIPLYTVVEAKRLHDKGWSIRRIAEKLDHPRTRIRTALRHHYPEKKSR